MSGSGKAEEAKRLFLQGANCAQAVLGAFADECGISREEAFRIASGFGAGIGRLREVCGAVSGMVLVLNFIRGGSDLSDKSSKDAHYELIQKLVGEFRKETGSIVCRELLGLDGKRTDSPVSEERTAQYYKKRPCPEMVALAAEILERNLFPG